MDSIDPAEPNTRLTHPSQSQLGKRKIGDASSKTLEGGNLKTLLESLQKKTEKFPK